MKLFMFLVGQVKDVSERSLLVKLAWFFSMAYVFLWVPDVDLIFIGILHHRSIITHSILPALLLIILGKNAGAAPLAGALIGLAVHLSCDMLSPMVGFAQIWLPAPLKAPIGLLSYPWLFLNALFAFWIAGHLAMKAFGVWAGYVLMFLASTATAFSYGVLNENSVFSVVISLVVFAASLVGLRRQILSDPVAAMRLKKSSEGLKAVHGGAIATLERVTKVVTQASDTIQEFNENLDLRGEFWKQSGMLEASLSLAQELVDHDRKIEAKSEEFKRIYEKIEREWEHDEKDAAIDRHCSMRDLLALSFDDVLPRQVDELNDLQRKHRYLLIEIKAALQADPQVQVKFTEIMKQRGEVALLNQVLEI